MNSVDQVIRGFNRRDEEAHAQAVAKLYKLDYVNLVGYPILPRTLELIPLADIKRYSIVPFLKSPHTLHAALIEPNPNVITYIQNLANQLGLEVVVAICSASSVQSAINLQQIQAAQVTDTTHIAVDDTSRQTAIASINSKEQLELSLREANATQVLDIIFAGATGMAASDIHIEPQEKDVRVRFRLDGVLQEITNLNPGVYHQVLSRIKYLAKMKLDVKKSNQDGRFTITSGNSDLDVRVSTLPSTWGEIINLRLLTAHAEFVKLDELGLSPEGLETLKTAIKLPHGMILVTGPTGSGKTTTLYAVIDTLNQPGVKIITLEDPIEYRLKGIDQVAISHNQGGMSFADGLRGALRQDPDILLVGEIRDQETAEIGLSAAMTGHLFLSTLHTNNAPASLARLLDMGIEPYKIAGTINLIIAQRLVRKICTTCRGQGCEVCLKTGYKGRLPILEYLKPSKALDDALMRHAAVSELYQIALDQGMIPMHQDGMNKVAQGLTTEAEVNRVTAENTI